MSSASRSAEIFSVHNDTDYSPLSSKVFSIIGRMGAVYGILGLYALFVPVGSENQLVSALLLVALCVALVLRSRANLSAFIVSLFVAYSVYSIVITFYIFPDRFPFPVDDALSPFALAVGLRLLWMFVVSLFALPRYRQSKTVPTIGDSGIVFWGAIAVLIYILIAEMDRDLAGSQYAVRISAVYEYSYLVVVVAALFIGRTSVKSRTRALAVVALLLMAQDVFYGGRISSVEIAFVLAITVGRRYLSAWKVTFLGLAGILLAWMVGWIRSSLGGGTTLQSGAFSKFAERLLTSDTVQYAYYGSLTQIQAAQSASSVERWDKFGEFTSQVIFGGQESLTRFVSREYFINFGGGIFPSAFYFWGGFGLVVAGCLALALILQVSSSGHTAYSAAVSAVVIGSSPRWVLYTPAALFRPIVLITLLFLVIQGIQHSSTALSRMRQGPTKDWKKSSEGKAINTDREQSAIPTAHMS